MRVLTPFVQLTCVKIWESSLHGPVNLEGGPVNPLSFIETKFWVEFAGLPLEIKSCQRRLIVSSVTRKNRQMSIKVA